MRCKIRIFALLLVAGLTTAQFGACAGEARGQKAVSLESGPRKVVVGTSMYNMSYEKIS